MKPLGVYVHIPFCVSRCVYCDFVSSIYDDARAKAYCAALREEIARAAERLDGYTADTVYFGGGTPSVLGADRFADLAQTLRRYLRCAIREWTVECNPESVTSDKLRRYRDCGVTRISLGVQSLRADTLRFLGRAHDADSALRAAALCAEEGFDVGADAMLGLPGQTAADANAFAERITAAGVRHVSAYTLSVEAGTPLAKMTQAGLSLPDGDACADLYDAMQEALAARGLYRYEVSNFAAAGKECAHNLKYWRCEDYAGFGAAAHGKLGHTRYFNPDDLAAYEAAIEGGELAWQVEEELTPDAERRERVMLELRTARGLDVARFERDFQTDFYQKNGHVLRKNAQYLTDDGSFIAVRPEYFFVMNSLLIDFADV